MSDQMENLEINNSLGRLHAIMTKAKALGSQGNPKSTAGALWAEVFGVEIPPKTHGSNLPPDKQEEVIERLIQLRQLIKECEMDLSAIRASERFFRSFDKVRNVVYVSLLSLATDLQGTFNSITDGDLNVLEFGAEKLADERPEPIIDKDELREIAKMVDALFDEVRTSKAGDEELRTFILEQLEITRRAIHEYWIRGSKRVREALAQIGASFILNPQTVSSSSPLLDKLRGILVRLASAASESATKALVETGIKGLLTGGGQ